MDDATDSWVMDKALRILEGADPDLMLLQLPYMDHAQHHWGKGSQEAWAQLAWTDHQIGRLLKYLTEEKKLKNTLMIVTSDHGQNNYWVDVDVLEEMENNGIEATLHPAGVFFYLYLENGEKAGEVVKIIEEWGVTDGIWCGENIDEIHLGTPYTGDVIVSLKPPYRALYPTKFFGVKSGPASFGEHGGISELDVFMVFFGPRLKRGVIYENGASLTDIVPTVCSLTGLPFRGKFKASPYTITSMMKVSKRPRT